MPSLTSPLFDCTPARAKQGCTVQRRHPHSLTHPAPPQPMESKAVEEYEEQPSQVTTNGDMDYSDFEFAQGRGGLSE